MRKFNPFIRRAARLPLTIQLQRRFESDATPKNMKVMETPNSDAKLDEMANMYSQMTLKEITQLQRLIFKKLGHSDEFYEQALLRGLGGGGGGGAAVAAQPAAIAAAPAAEEEEAPEPPKPKAEKSSFDLVVKEVPPAAKIQLIKAVREVLKLPLGEAKSTVEKAPGTMLKGIGKDDAEKMKQLFAAQKVELTLV